MRIAALVIVLALFAPSLTRSPLVSRAPSLQDSCTTEQAELQKETADFNAAIALFDNDCGQASPEDYAAKSCAQRADQLKDWRNTLNRKIMDHNARCGGAA